MSDLHGGQARVLFPRCMQRGARTGSGMPGLTSATESMSTRPLLEAMMNDTQKQQQKGTDAASPPQTPDELIGELPPDAIQSDANDNSFLADLPEEGAAKP